MQHMESVRSNDDGGVEDTSRKLSLTEKLVAQVWALVTADSPPQISPKNQHRVGPNASYRTAGTRGSAKTALTRRKPKEQTITDDGTDGGDG